LTPANGSVLNRAPLSLSITFDQHVQKHTSGNITILNLTANTAEVIPVTSGSVGISGTVVTLTPASLVNNQEYAVLIDFGAFRSLGAELPFAGIADTSIWRFTALDNGSIIRFR